MAKLYCLPSNPFHLYCFAPVLPTPQVYCLPDNYEVADRSLDDIRAVLNPSFTREVRLQGFRVGILLIARTNRIWERSVYARTVLLWVGALSSCFSVSSADLG
jgi:hypothetical protein